MRGATAFVDRGRRTTRRCYNLYATVKMLTTRDGPAVIDAKAGYWPTIVLSAHPSIPPAFDAPIRELLLEYCHNVWCGETRLVWLPSDENNLTIRLCILTTHEPDIQTDRRTDERTDTAQRHIPCLWGNAYLDILQKIEYSATYPWGLISRFCSGCPSCHTPLS